MVAAFLCCLALVSGKHAKRSHEKKQHENRKPVGKDDLIDGDIDYDHVSPKDCASYLCASDVDLATEYIEEGCPGPFSRYGIEDEGDVMPQDMQEFTASEPIFEQ